MPDHQPPAVRSRSWMYLLTVH